MVGAYAGNRLGAIRDAKGKSVATVFMQLGGNQKAEVRPTNTGHTYAVLTFSFSYLDSSSLGCEGAWCCGK